MFGIVPIPIDTMPVPTVTVEVSAQQSADVGGYVVVGTMQEGKFNFRIEQGRSGPSDVSLVGSYANAIEEVQAKMPMSSFEKVKQLAAAIRQTSGVVDVVAHHVVVDWDEKCLEETYQVIAFTDPEDLDAGAEAYACWREFVDIDGNPHVGLDLLPHATGEVESYLQSGYSKVS